MSIIEKFVAELEMKEQAEDLYHSVYFIPNHYKEYVIE